MSYDRFEETQLDTFGFQSKNTVKVFEPTELSDDALLENSYSCMAISYSKLKLFAIYNRQLCVLSLPTLSKSIENPALGKNEILTNQHEVLLDIDYDALQIYLNFNSTILYLLTSDGKIVSCDVESLLKGDLVTTVLDFTDQVLRFCPSSESESVLILTKSNNLLLLKDKIEPLLDNIGSVNWYGLTDSEIIYSHSASNEVIIANVNDISNHIDLINIELDDECPEIIDFKVFSDDKFVIFTCDQLESPNSQIAYVVNNKVIRQTDNIFNMFSMVDRLTSFYSQLLPKWSEIYPELLVGLSSKSEDISIITPDFQLDLLNDQDMATLPLFDDNDTSAIGFAIDITSTEKVVEPCKGIEESEALPRVYILNNYGQLVSWNIWSSVDMRNNKANLEECLTALKLNRPNDIGNGQPANDCLPVIDKAEDVTKSKSETNDSVPSGNNSGSFNNMQSQSGSSLGDENVFPENESAKTATSFTFKSSAIDSSKDNTSPFGSNTIKAGTTGLGSNVFGSNGFGSTGFGSTGFNYSASNGGSNSNSANNSKAKPFVTSQGGFSSFAGQTNAFSKINTGSNSLFSTESKPSSDSSTSPFGQLSDSKTSIFKKASTQKNTIFDQSQTTSIFGDSNITNDNPFSQPQQKSIFTDKGTDTSNFLNQQKSSLLDNIKTKTTGSLGQQTSDSTFVDDIYESTSKWQKNKKFVAGKEESANSSMPELPPELIAFIEKHKKIDPLNTSGPCIDDASDVTEDDTTLYGFSLGQAKEVASEDNIKDFIAPKEKTHSESISEEKSLDALTSKHGTSIDKNDIQEENNSLINKSGDEVVTDDRNSPEAECSKKSESKFDLKTKEANLNDSDFELVKRPDLTSNSYLLSDKDSFKNEEVTSGEESSIETELPSEEELSNEEESSNDSLESEKIKQSKDIDYIQSKYSGVKKELDQKETQEKPSKSDKTKVEFTTTTLYVNESVDVNTATVEYVDESTEFTPVYINDNTDFGSAEEHTILAFEGEETYLSKFYIPKPIPLLTARGKITYSEDINAYPSIGREIIKIVYDIETEFLVLNENVQNLTDYLQDQNSNKIMQHTLENSSQFPSHWRLCESETVARGIQDTVSDYTNIISETNEVFDKVKTMHQNVFLFAKKLVSIGIELKDLENEFKVAEENSIISSRSLSLENIKKREQLKKKALSLRVTYERLSQCILILNSQLHPERIVSPQFECILSSIQKAIHHNMDNIQDLKLEVKKFTDAGKPDPTEVSSRQKFRIVLDEESVRLQMERILAREARKRMVTRVIKQIPFTIERSL